jgi:hypothetical protein
MNSGERDFTQRGCGGLVSRSGDSHATLR